MPSRPSLDPADVVRRLGGRARAHEIQAWSTRHLLGEAVATGRLLRARTGMYVLPALPEPQKAAARAGGVLSHLSAAQHWELATVIEPDAVDVTVPHSARPAREPGVRLHWARSPPGPAVRVTPVLQTVLDCATTLPFPEALAIADSAVAERLVRPDRLIQAAAASPARGRRRRLTVALAADHRAENAFESCLRGVVIEAGVRGFEPQLEIRLPTRTVHVDLGDPQRRIVLEADSFAHHGTRAALMRDCERYDELVSCGWEVLRFSWEHVMFRQDWVARVVKMTCARGGSLMVRAGEKGVATSLGR